MIHILGKVATLKAGDQSLSVGVCIWDRGLLTVTQAIIVDAWWNEPYQLQSREIIPIVYLSGIG
jgi:hypothetical protein